MIAMVDGALHIVIAMCNIVIFSWMVYWAVRFWRSCRRGENGITFAMSILFFALALDRLWSVSAAIYTMFSVPPLFLLLSLSVRLVTVCFIVAGMVFITWRFANEQQNDNKQNSR